MCIRSLQSAGRKGRKKLLKKKNEEGAKLKINTSKLNNDATAGAKDESVRGGCDTRCKGTSATSIRVIKRRGMPREPKLSLIYAPESYFFTLFFSPSFVYFAIFYFISHFTTFRIRRLYLHHCQCTFGKKWRNQLRYVSFFPTHLFNF